MRSDLHSYTGILPCLVREGMNHSSSPSPPSSPSSPCSPPSSSSPSCIPISGERISSSSSVPDVILESESPVQKISRYLSNNENDNDSERRSDRILVPYSYRLVGWYFSLYHESEKHSNVLSYDTREIISLTRSEQNDCRLEIQFCLNYRLELLVNSPQEVANITSAFEQLGLNYSVELQTEKVFSPTNSSHLFANLLKLEVFDQVSALFCSSPHS